MKATAEKQTHTTPASLQTKPVQPFFTKAGGGDFFAPAPPSVQTKLAVNTPGDKYEVEADHMADKVMRMSGTGRLTPQKDLESQPEKKLLRKETGPAQPAEGLIQQPGEENVQVASSQTEATIRSKTSGGQPLPAETRSFMEPRFGNDFSNVRVHQDQGSAQLNNQLNARAFTYQNHIFFGEGQYQPQSPQGKQLLAHELTHVVQQGASKGLNSNSDFGRPHNAGMLQTKPSDSTSPVIQRGLLDDVREGANAVAGAISGIVTSVRQAIGGGIAAATTWIRSIASGIGAGISAAWTFIRNLASTVRLGVDAAWSFIRGIATRIGQGVTSAWEWIRGLAGRLNMGITNAWNFIQAAATRMAMNITNAWNFIQTLASRLAMGITNAWTWVQTVASNIALSITSAWNWIQAVASRIGMHLPASWGWVRVLASRLAMGITNSWNWVQAMASRLATGITNAWNRIQSMASALAMRITNAWNWIQFIASRIAMGITNAWNWVQVMATRIAMRITNAWNWVQMIASRLAMAITNAWNWVIAMALKIAKGIINAWNWLVSLARKLVKSLLEAWDWYWHAPDIAISTDLDAADGSGKSRRKVGVGERVAFRGSKTGDWSASGGSPLTSAGTLTFDWTAPVRGASVTISLTSGKYTRSVVMNVLEPNQITARRTGVMSFTRGRLGAGMRLKFQYFPKSVSFGNVEAKEVSGPASNIQGYFAGRTGNFQHHDSGDTFLPIQNNNEDSATDEAGFWNYPSPWIKGRYDWVIPNHFRVTTEGGDGKKFTEVNQVHTIEGTDGTAKVTKAGAEVERTP